MNQMFLFVYKTFKKDVMMPSIKNLKNKSQHKQLKCSKMQQNTLNFVPIGALPAFPYVQITVSP